jgi:hypothetical protein
MSSRKQSPNAHPLGRGLDLSAVEAASAADRQFFEANPNVTSRVRALVPGETYFEPVPPGYAVRVLVTQLAPGFRTRAIFFEKVLQHGPEEQH